MGLNQVYEILKKKFDDGWTQIFYKLKEMSYTSEKVTKAPSAHLFYVTSPLDFKYVAQVQFVLSTIGSWPHKKFGRTRLDDILSIYNLLLIMIAIIWIILEVSYIQQNKDKMSFFDLGHLVLCISFVLLYTVHRQTHIISGVFTLYVMLTMLDGVSLFTFMPWLNNYRRGMFGENRPANSTFEHSVYYFLPDAVYTDVEGYWILFLINIPTSYVITIGLCVFDLLLSLIVFQIWGHLKILKYNLLNMPLPAGSTSMYSKDENIQIKTLLKENILHHNFIIKFVDGCSDTFSEYLFAFYLLMQFITCILLLEVTTFTANSLAKYGPLTIAMNQQLIQVSILFEMLNTKSEELVDAVYAMPWECMDTTNRKTVMILLHRVQTPVSLKAAKVVPVGVNTMTAVLKTTWSYFMMLKALAGER